MAIILFGGSFNPIHNGHLAMARAALDFLPDATLVMIPAACSPFKVGDSMADEKHRLAMCRLATAELPRIQVSDVEFTMEKPSFTIHTVERLKAETPDDYYFLCGADSFLSLQQWKEYEKLLTMVTFLVADRAGATHEELLAQQTRIGEQGGKSHLLSMPRVNVSSTAVRDGKGASGEHLPLAVARYIQENHLYQE